MLVPQFVEGEAVEDEDAAQLAAGLGSFGASSSRRQLDLFGNVVEQGADAEAGDGGDALAVTKEDLEHIVDELSDDEDQGDVNAKHAELMLEEDAAQLEEVKRRVEEGYHRRMSPMQCARHAGAVY